MDESRFIKVHANLPVNLRNQIVLVLKDEEENKIPITWNVAYLEIENKTKLGEKIFKKLVDLKII
ncbi:hypothetical protein ACFL29_01750 [Patescibacteria group bacterium]